MKGISPTPAKNFLPDIYEDSTAKTALTDKIDSDQNSLKQEIRLLQWIVDIDRCPGEFLPELGYKLGVTLLATETDREKRVKLFNAIESHKRRFTGKYDIFARIDAITGLSVSVFKYSEGDFILGGDGLDDIINPDGGILGGDSTYPGFVMSGFWDEPDINGNINLDLGGDASLSSLLIDDVVQMIITEYGEPVFKVWLGYVSSGVFITYANGEVKR